MVMHSFLVPLQVFLSNKVVITDPAVTMSSLPLMIIKPFRSLEDLIALITAITVHGLPMMIQIHLLSEIAVTSPAVTMQRLTLVILKPLCALENPIALIAFEIM